MNVGNECKFVEFEGVLVLRPKSNLRHDRIGFTCWKRRTHGTKQGYRLTDLFLNHTCRSGVVDRTSVNSKHSGAKSTEMDINSTKFAHICINATLRPCHVTLINEQHNIAKLFKSYLFGRVMPDLSESLGLRTVRSDSRPTSMVKLQGLPRYRRISSHAF